MCIRDRVRRRPEYQGFSLDDLRRQGYLAPERTYYNYKRCGFHTPTGKFELLSTEMAKACLLYTSYQCLRKFVDNLKARGEAPAENAEKTES